MRPCLDYSVSDEDEGSSGLSASASSACQSESAYSGRLTRRRLSAILRCSGSTRSTRKELKVDICSVCHPFYTGKLKFIDTAGRIEKFKNKFAAAGYASLGKGKKKPEAAVAAET